MKTAIAVMVGMLLLGGCSGKSGRESQGGAGSAPLETTRGKGAEFLAYTHSIVIDAEESQVKILYGKLVAACKADVVDGCTLLDSTLSSGREVNAHISMRAKPAGIKNLIGLAAADGQVTSQATHVEDLARPIVDSDKRLSMLRQYQQKLLELQRRANEDVDSLIKLSKELATIQAELEQESGANAHLMEQINTDVLNVDIGQRLNRSFWSPVRAALADFSGNLSSGVAGAIVGLAYLLPWCLIFLIFFPLARKLWRRMRS